MTHQAEGEALPLRAKAQREREINPVGNSNGLKGVRMKKLVKDDGLC